MDLDTYYEKMVSVALDNRAPAAIRVAAAGIFWRDAAGPAYSPLLDSLLSTLWVALYHISENPCVRATPAVRAEAGRIAGEITLLLRQQHRDARDRCPQPAGTASPSTSSI
jgi:hypothetical protein